MYVGRPNYYQTLNGKPIIPNKLKCFLFLAYFEVNSIHVNLLSSTTRTSLAAIENVVAAAEIRRNARTYKCHCH